jgi:ribosomal protein S18 acetylase RimI-like enzyme
VNESAASCFSATYAAARTAFMSAVAAAGGAITSYRHPLTGPAGEPLFLDTARVGTPEARRVLFIAAGTHGIEGFCGSGIQTFLLRNQVTEKLPADIALVLVHGVNPWGFAWSRRVNEDNVDLNRNFLDHTQPHPENPDYDRLNTVLNPAVLEDGNVAEFITAVQHFEQERGAEAVYRSLSGGQYRHPQGLQYGGCTPVWSNRVVRALWSQHASGVELAVFIDLHSGLGPRGFGLVLQTAPGDSVDARLAAEWWPEVVRAEPAQGGDAALVSGLIGPAFSAAQSPGAGVGIVLEFGTVEMTEVMLAVQADNWLQHHGDRDSVKGRQIAARMRAAFFVDADDWKAEVCERAHGVVQRCLAGMAAFVNQSAHNGSAVVRAARLAEAEILVGFEQAMARETEAIELDLPTLRAGVVKLLDDPTLGRVFVVEDNGLVVATLMVTQEWSDWRNGMFWWIQSVYVSPAHRRQGHYRRLHDHVYALAERNPEVCGIRLYVEHENRNAQATYRALGMSETAYRLFEQSTRTAPG